MKTKQLNFATLKKPYKRTITFLGSVFMTNRTSDVLYVLYEVPFLTNLGIHLMGIH